MPEKLSAAERRRQRILGNAGNRLSKLTGEDDRMAPAMDFGISRNTEIDDETKRRLDMIASKTSNGDMKNLTTPRLKNPYMEMPKAGPKAGPNATTQKPTAVQVLTQPVQFLVLLFLTLFCFMSQINYGIALTVAIIGFFTVHYFGLREFIKVPPILGMVPGKLQILAKIGYYLYRMVSYKKLLLINKIGVEKPL